MCQKWKFVCLALKIGCRTRANFMCFFPSSFHTECVTSSFFLSIWLMQLFFSKIISIFSHIWRSNISLKKFILLRSCHWHTVMHTNAKHVQYVRVNLIFVSIWIMDVQSACRLWFYTFMDNITWHMSDTLCRELGR